MPSRRPADADPTDDFAGDIDRQSSGEKQNVVVHILQPLNRRCLGDELGDICGRSAHARSRIGFFLTAFDGMRPSRIGSHERSQDPGPIDDRHADAIPVLSTFIQRG